MLITLPNKDLGFFPKNSIFVKTLKINDMT